MRDFLYSEISQVERMPNIPEDPEHAIEAGKGLCENVLEPIQAALGKVSIRSGYRSPALNGLGNDKGYNCGSNEYNCTRHIWDSVDADGHIGATACIVVNAFTGYYETTCDWPALAWWLHDHVPAYRDVMFYPSLAAFNINWYSGPVTDRKISSYVPNPQTGKKGILVRPGMDGFDTTHPDAYADWLRTLQ